MEEDNDVPDQRGAETSSPQSEQPNVTNNDNQNSTVSENILSDIQNRIFYAIFYRLALLYTRIVPHYIIRVHEFTVLCSGLISLFTLIYLRITMNKYNSQCLSAIGPTISESMVYRINLVFDRPARTPYFLQQAQKDILQNSTCVVNNITTKQYDYDYKSSNIIASVFQYLFEGLFKPEEFCLEFSYEYGLLRLSDKMRKQLNIQVIVVEIEPSDPRCFGNLYWRLMLREFLGYQEIILSNIKQLLGNNKRGYVRNVITGETFRFVSTWVTELSFLAAMTVMVLYTLSISILLRYCHNQIFFFIVELLQVLDMNVIVVGSPIAPFITAILALIGIETIMSEFFNDNSTAFLVIVLVWMADQFYSVCCRTEISLKYWVRFFYTYQFVFYAYFVRYNGQYAGLALFTTYCFVVHSMLYFLNHYEFPALVTSTQDFRNSQEHTNRTLHQRSFQ